jgi:low affinity Fe/Cu permease
MSLGKAFARFANATARWAGHPATFISCCVLVLAWAASGPFFGFSETWQLVINTGTTIITFLMVFVIQNSQNRDGAAIQAKLDELIRASEAQNAFIGIENLSQEEVDAFRRRCEEAARREGADNDAAQAIGDQAAAATTTASRRLAAGR